MDFHPRMLAQQHIPRPAKAPPRHFHPGMLSQQPLAGLGAVAPAPSIGQSIQFDAAQGTITVGGSTIKLVPAVISAIAVKLIFFGGSKAAQGAKALHRKWKGSPAAATNPGKRSERPWQAKRFNPSTGKKVATKRHKTKAAAERWAAAHGGPGRASYVG
jgi:hypothetical protein